MAAALIHELNQPLGAIATFSQAGERMLSRPQPMTSAALEVLQHINREAMNAGEGIRRIRRLFNQRGVNRPPCSMRDLVSELKPVLDLLASRFDSALVVHCDDVLPLVAVDRPERVTIDTGLWFSTSAGSVGLGHLSVAEVKQERIDRTSLVMARLRELGVRPGGFSKYCMGVSLLVPGVKHNRFKPRLRRIDRLAGDLTHVA